MDKEGDEEPPIARVQLMGQPAVISSQRPPPTNILYTQNEYLCTHYPAKESTLYIRDVYFFPTYSNISKFISSLYNCPTPGGICDILSLVCSCAKLVIILDLIRQL